MGNGELTITNNNITALEIEAARGYVKTATAMGFSRTMATHAVITALLSFASSEFDSIYAGTQTEERAVRNVRRALDTVGQLLDES